MNTITVGDKIEVQDAGLEMLRKLCPGMPPNHYGMVDEILSDGTLMILFDDTKQVAPYPASACRKRSIFAKPPQNPPKGKHPDMFG